MIPEKQEPKYSSDQGGIFNRQSGEYIPHDEPVFILRARDKHAVEAISYYYDIVGDAHHAQVVMARREQFHAFAKEHPERMKEPDTDKSINLQLIA